MSLTDRVNSMSLLRLIIVGIIGTAWLMICMMIVVGSIGAYRMGKWMPDTMDKVMGKVGDAVKRAQAGSPVDETEYEVAEVENSSDSKDAEQT